MKTKKIFDSVRNLKISGASGRSPDQLNPLPVGGGRGGSFLGKFGFCLLFLCSLFFLSSALQADDATQVMPAKQRAKIVALAQSIFDPQIKTSVKIGKVSSPFSAAPGSN